jgi:hypothetical protein
VASPSLCENNMQARSGRMAITRIAWSAMRITPINCVTSQAIRKKEIFAIMLSYTQLEMSDPIRRRLKVPGVKTPYAWVMGCRG